MYRAAVIGCGKIGSTFADDPRQKNVYAHAHAYTVCKSTQLVAVSDPDANRLTRATDRWQVPRAYLDSNELLDVEHPELVSICTPDHTHYSLIRAALTTPGVRAILAEKPLALDLAQAEELIALARSRCIVLAVNYSRRYANNHARWRNKLHGGLLGQIEAIHGYYTKGTLHNGTHWFDLLRYFAGEVTCVRGFDYGRKSTTDPTFDAVLELETGAVATLQGLGAEKFTLFEMELVGSMGRLRILDSGHTIELYGIQPSMFYSDYQMLRLVERDRRGMGDVTLCAVQDLLACLETGKSPLCSAEDARAALAIGLAVREGAQTGKLVDISIGRQ